MAVNRVSIVAKGMKSFGKSVTQANTALGLPPSSPPSKTVAAGTSAKKELTSTKSELTSTKTELTSTKSELTSTKTELTSTKSELTSTKSELTTTKNNLTSTQSALNSANTRISALLAEIEALKKSGGGGAFKLTSYTPGSPAVTGISSVVISGLSSNEDVDYTSANGTYTVTSETEREPSMMKRVFKHSGGSWYFWIEGEEEYSDYSMYIGRAVGEGTLSAWTDQTPESGTFTFEDWDYGYSFEVELGINTTDYPEESDQIEGVASSGYDSETGTWTWGGTAKITRYEKGIFGLNNVPSPLSIHAAAGDTVFGRFVGYDGADLKQLALAYHFFSAPSNRADSGQEFIDTTGDSNWPQDERYLTVDGINCMGDNNKILYYQHTFTRDVTVPKFNVLQWGATVIATVYLLPPRTNDDGSVTDLQDVFGGVPFVSLLPKGGSDGLAVGLSGGDGAGITGAFAGSIWSSAHSKSPGEGWHQLAAVLRPDRESSYGTIEIWVDGEKQGESRCDFYGECDTVRFHRNGGFVQRGPDEDRGGYVSRCYAIGRAMAADELRYTWHDFSKGIKK